MVPTAGSQMLLRMMLRGDDTIVPAGGNFFLGLCNQLPNETDILSDITTEPTIGVGNYARQPIVRSSLGWATEVIVNAAAGLRAEEVTFAASGADFDKPFSRAFLCDVATGFTGTLFAYSGNLATPLVILDGQSFPFQFEYYLD